jgi:tRNA modification GTPase
MRSPHSYTAEDVIEINGHGGLVPLLRILELVLKEGARLAEPGEFTKRAFLHGRIDLTQAEAVAEIIRAKSERGLRLAMHHLDGSLSKKIGDLKGRLLSILAEIETAVDFPEEDLLILSREEMERKTEEVELELKRLAASFQEGRIFQEGIITPIIGRTNVGKSSLFNALLERERAIVTPYPGTTRDSLEEMIRVQGLPFLLIDTAGMRTGDPHLGMAEKAGMKRGRAWMEKADLLLLVIDGSEALTGEDRCLLQQARGHSGLVLVNKMDLGSKVEMEELLRLLPGMPCMRISAQNGQGLQELKGAMFEMMERAGIDMTQDLVITNLHHRSALRMAEDAIARGKESMASGLSFEFVSLDLKEGLDALGKITGETASEDLLEEIFSRFCIGK